MPCSVELPQQREFAQTSRKDRWWVVPTAVFLGLSAFIVYSTWAAFQGVHYYLTEGGAQFSPQYWSRVSGNGFECRSFERLFVWVLLT